jgi:hypothetical protein
MPVATHSRCVPIVGGGGGALPLLPPFCSLPMLLLLVSTMGGAAAAAEARSSSVAAATRVLLHLRRRAAAWGREEEESHATTTAALQRGAACTTQWFGVLLPRNCMWRASDGLIMAIFAMTYQLLCCSVTGTGLKQGRPHTHTPQIKKLKEKRSKRSSFLSYDELIDCIQLQFICIM